MSADMSPYCSAHDEWLIMKLCMYVGYYDANNVSNFGGDPIKLKKRLHFLRARRTIAMTRLLLRDHAQAAGVWKTVIGHTSLSTALVEDTKSRKAWLVWIYYGNRQTCILANDILGKQKGG